MRIESDSVLRHPRRAVFESYRDDLPEIIDLLPNVRAVELLGREVEGPVVKLRSLYHGGTEFPESLAKGLESRFLNWEDLSVWNSHHWRCDWQISALAFSDAIHCQGETRFIEIDETRTRLEIAGDLSVDLKRIANVPEFLAGSVGPKLESFLTRQIVNNLVLCTEGLAVHLGRAVVE